MFLLFVSEFSDAGFLLFVPECLYCLYQSAFTVRTRVLWCIYCSYQSSLIPFTVHTRVLWCFYCSYQSFLMLFTVRTRVLLLFVPEFSDAFTVRTRVLWCLYCLYQSSLLFVSEFSDAFTFHSRVLWCFYCSYQSSLMPLLFVLEFSKASDNLARVFSSHNYCNLPAEFANVLMVLYFILLTDIVEMWRSWNCQIVQFKILYWWIFEFIMVIPLAICILSVQTMSFTFFCLLILVSRENVLILTLLRWQFFGIIFDVKLDSFWEKL